MRTPTAASRSHSQAMIVRRPRSPASIPRSELFLHDTPKDSFPGEKQISTGGVYSGGNGFPAPSKDFSEVPAHTCPQPLSQADVRRPGLQVVFLVVAFAGVGVGVGGGVDGRTLCPPNCLTLLGVRTSRLDIRTKAVALSKGLTKMGRQKVLLPLSSNCLRYAGWGESGGSRAPRG